MRWFWDHYVPDAAQGRPLASPLSADLPACRRSTSRRPSSTPRATTASVWPPDWRPQASIRLPPMARRHPRLIMMSRMLPAADGQIAEVAGFLRRRLTS